MNTRLIPTCADQHPWAQSKADRHDPPGLIDELVPSRAAMVDAVLVRREDPVGEPVGAHCQTFSTRFNSKLRQQAQTRTARISKIACLPSRHEVDPLVGKGADFATQPKKVEEQAP